jgi:hypothetical protein
MNKRIFVNRRKYLEWDDIFICGLPRESRKNVLKEINIFSRFHLTDYLCTNRYGV